MTEALPNMALTRDEKIAMVHQAVASGIASVMENVARDISGGTPLAEAEAIMKRGTAIWFNSYSVMIKIILATESDGPGSK